MDFDRIPGATADGDLPDLVRERLALNLTDAATPEGEALSRTIAGVAGSADFEETGFEQLKHSLDSGLSAFVNVAGDSTGNGTDEWVYLFAQHLGSLYPNLRISHEVFNLTSQKYDPPTMIAAPGTARSARFQSGVVGYLIEPGSALQNVTDLDYRVHLALDAWAGAGVQCIASKFNAAGNRAWRVFIDGSKNLIYQWSADGTTLETQVSVSLSAHVNDGQGTWLRVTHDVDNGAAGNDIKFWKSQDGVAWTQLGTTTTRPGVTSIKALPSVELSYGARSGGVEQIVGNIYRSELRDGIDGPLVAAPFPDQWGRASSVTTVTYVGNPTLYIVNGSCSGYAIDQLAGIGERLFYPGSYAASFLSCSHNDGPRSPGIAGPLWDALLAKKAARQPYAPLLFTTQNPRIAPATWIAEHATRMAWIRGYARAKGGFIVDSYRAYLRHPGGLASILNADGFHPNAAGSAVWSGEVIARWGQTR